MIKNLFLLIVSILLVGASAFASDLELEEIFPIEVTKQNQSKYNIEVNVSLPTDLEGYIVENTKDRVVTLKVPKKIDGGQLINIHVSVKQKGSHSTHLIRTSIAFGNDFNDNTAVLSSFDINIEAINDVRLSLNYLNSEYFYLIDLNSYIGDKNR